MSKYVYRLSIPIVFDAGLCPGGGRESNRISVSFNGRKEAVLHGSSVAGVLRSALRSEKSIDVEEWFGCALERSESVSWNSRVKIADVILDPGKGKVDTRTHNAINRHTGAAIKGGLFSLDSLPPGTKTVFSIEIDGRELSQIELNEFTRRVADLLEMGLFFGGNRNRGIGKATAPEGVFVEEFDLATVDGYAAYLDSRYVNLSGKKENIRVVRGAENSDVFKLSLSLAIPRGEDLLVGDGQTMDYVLEPQQVTDADGCTRWRIPGSTFRGVFRAWMSRLAARDDRELRDDADSFYEGKTDVTGENIGWGFVKSEKKKQLFKENPKELKDPIMSLFGSLYARGRIHFPDSYSINLSEEYDAPERKHVSVDRFTGGANEGSLFQNRVLVGSAIEFPFTVMIESAEDYEIDWLVRTIKALHLGVISMGSSKSAGRLAVKSVIKCTNNEVTNGIQSFLEAHK